MALEKIWFFLKFSHDKSMGAKEHQDVTNLDSMGYCWQDACRGPLDIATY